MTGRTRGEGRSGLELWGGIECTVNRVGDVYVDQVAQSGHADRDDDLDRLAALGIRTWRYPILWERTAPGDLADADWSWADRRLSRMRELGLDPIVGLLHHGSGPPTTSLLDPAFPRKLAEYAGAVAARFPWVRRWTPVNEPLSTARFSGLDGHWYPHATSPEAFARALVGQCHGIVLATRAIRRERPDAELVLTEDVCRQSSTPTLREVAAFRNARRFLGIDLVCGRVVPGHPFHAWLVARGIPEAELAAIADEAVTPAILGANYYVTSDRFLDDELGRHPGHRRFHGPEGRYAETESVRTTLAGPCGHRAVLGELWERYRIPVAVTEVHLGCTREEQVRWLLEAWDAARLAREEDGADVRAVTAWGAFGLFGWDRLVTRPGGTYEPGLFDVRGPEPRPTALARVAADLAAGREPDAPWGGAGWWRRSVRFIDRRPIAASVGGCGPERPLPPPRPERPLLVIGGGAFAREVLRACELRGLATVAPGRALDATDGAELERYIRDVRPWAVVHAAGVRDPFQAEQDPDRCARLHREAPSLLARFCREGQARLAVLSSSLVLPGPGPHDEAGPVAPRMVLGAVQADGERVVLERHPAAMVLRCGFMLGLDRADDLLHAGLDALRAGRRWGVPAGASFVIAPLLAGALLDLLVDGDSGIRHLAHPPPVLLAAREAAGLAELDPESVHEETHSGARLRSARGEVLPGWRRALAEVVRRYRDRPAPGPLEAAR